MKKIIFFNFFFTILIIFTLELLANFLKISNLMGVDSELINTNNENHITYKKNSTGLIFNNRIFTDQYGFRIPQPVISKSDFKYNKNQSIILYGDSVTFGNGIDEEFTFAGLLRKKFIDKNIYNISLPGYQINNHINNLFYLDELKNVNKIIYFYTLNDIDPNINIKEKDIEKQQNKNIFETLKKNTVLKKINHFLRDHSYLYLFIKGVASDPSKRWFLQDYKMYANLTYLENKFLILRKRSAKDGIDLKIFILPYEYQTRVDKCNKNNLKPQTKVREVLIKLNINFEDLTEKFCDNKNPKSLFYKFDPMHLSKKGHQFVYNLIKNEI